MLFLYVFSMICGKLGWAYQQNKMNRQTYKQTYDSSNNTYIDWKGTRRDATTNEPYVILKDKNGDLIRKDINWNTIKNYSLEKRTLKFMSDNGYSVIPLSDVNVNHSGLQGIRYKDKKSGDIYVIRQFMIKNDKTNKKRPVHFFMNINTLHLVRIVDYYEWIYNYIPKETIDSFINNFNYRQDNDSYLNYLSWKKYHNENIGILFNKEDQDRRINIYE